MGGGRRSSPYDWVKQEQHMPHWLEVRDMTARVLRSEKLEVGTDLVATLIRVLHEFSSDGWQIENFKRECSYFFCNKNGVRRVVSITPTEPENRPQITKQL